MAAKAPAKHWEAKGADAVDPKSKEKLKLEDSNLANYGSAEHKALKLKVAKTETAWAGAGAAPGDEVWRVEKFHIVRWPREKFGSFYDGDSYIVLHTYKAKDAEGKETDKLAYNVHFWLGKKSSQDERGVAAYKTVELDDLLGDLPVQFRETQGHETKEFLGIFGTIKIMSGGIDSGFNHVKAAEYKARLVKVDGVKAKFVRADEVPVARTSLNNGCVFVLDAGLDVFQWNGLSATIWEKRKAEEVVEGILGERNGLARKTILDANDDDAKFWGFLGGKGAVAAAAPKPDAKLAAAPGDHWGPVCHKDLYRVHIKPGATEAAFNVVAPSGTQILKSHFLSAHVFILDIEDHSDHEHNIYVWVGNGTSKSHQSMALLFGQEYATKGGFADNSKIIRVMEGNTDPAFNAAIAATAPAPVARAAGASTPASA